MPQFVKLADLSRLPLGGSLEVEHDGRIYALFHQPDGSIHVIDGICPHQGGPLAEGERCGIVVTCPWHGWQFDVTTGRSPNFTRVSVPTYEARVEGEDVLVAVP